MLQSALATRSYTGDEVAPLLDTPAMRQTKFTPQIIPFYAATRSFGNVRRAYPNYSYKEAAVNPTNPRDKATGWEVDVINVLQKNQRKEIVGERNTSVGPALFLARPIIAEKQCLECHGIASTAPPSQVRIYGATSGFGWQENQVIGAQIVSVPSAVPKAVAHRAFLHLMVSLFFVLIFTLAALNLALYYIVIRPVGKISWMAEEISDGNLNVLAIPAQGPDEIATLARAFNRLHVNLLRALRSVNHEATVDD